MTAPISPAPRCLEPPLAARRSPPRNSTVRPAIRPKTSRALDFGRRPDRLELRGPEPRRRRTRATRRSPTPTSPGHWCLGRYYLHFHHLLATLSTASYQAKDIHGIWLSNNDMTGWKLAGQNLSGAILDSGTLSNANLTNANLSGAQFLLRDADQRQFDQCQSDQCQFFRGDTERHNFTGTPWPGPTSVPLPSHPRNSQHRQLSVAGHARHRTF